MNRAVLLAASMLTLATAPACAQAQNPEQSVPREEAGAGGKSVEAGAPSAPELKPAFAGQTRAPAVKSAAQPLVTEVARGFDMPWALAFLPDGRMLVTEKAAGTIRIVTAKGAKSAPLAGLPAVDARDQGGMLDVEVGPDFARSPMVYFSYAEPRDGGNGLAVARGRLMDGAAPKLTDVQVIFRAQPTLDSTKHFGGRLSFAPDGMLFVTLGERSDLPGRVQAQKPDSHFGKTVRIMPDGTVPKDNPGAKLPSGRPEIWSWGHRNALAQAFDAQGQLWQVEMGPRGGDELNLVQAGKDYGWPTIGYGKEYSGAPIHSTSQAAGMEQPRYYWDPVISPSGMVVVRGSMFPAWRGNVLVGALSGKSLVRLVLDGARVTGEERLLTERGERIREVAEAPDGALWLLTDDGDGKLLRVTPGGRM
jgi:glucose/arabinose dehydrogenase